ncbi:MAG: tetraacyldisaccharide 4'-kinase [Oligoflexia bacterium]|nr:tetraacyldisaccharide 4'-kinase [Oligoflexia bacterium]
MIQRGLLPIAWLYGAVAAGRNLAFDWGLLRRYRSTLPVVSIGNAVLGGTGKTPAVIQICRLLVAEGAQPVVLTRGYGGRTPTPHLVSDGDSAEAVGDEALMMQQLHGLKVVVSPQRVQGAKYIESQKLGTVIVLDDGLQHRWLDRNLDLMCIDLSSPKAADQFREGACLPAGRFREPKRGALRRVHGVVFSARSQQPVHFEGLDLPPRLERFTSLVEVEKIANAHGAELPTGAVVTALSAIAGPGGFHSTLQLLGFRVGERLVYPDHHRYTEADIKRIRQRAQGTPIVITEKDAVKVAGLLPEAYICRIRAKIEPEMRLRQLFREKGILQNSGNT